MKTQEQRDEYVESVPESERLVRNLEDTDDVVVEKGSPSELVYLLYIKEMYGKDFVKTYGAAQSWGHLRSTYYSEDDASSDDGAVEYNDHGTGDDVYRLLDVAGIAKAWIDEMKGHGITRSNASKEELQRIGIPEPQAKLIMNVLSNPNPDQFFAV